MSGAQRPLFVNAPQMPTGPMVGSPSPGGSPLAAAMARPMGMPNLPPPSMGIPSTALAALMKPDPSYGNPNGEASLGASATPGDQAAMLNALPNGQIPQIGQPGAPIGPGFGGPLPSPQLSSPDMMAKIGQWLQGLRGSGNAQ